MAGELRLNGVKLVYKNFEGREGDYNREGDRSFSVVLEPDMAEQLAAEGWNVKWPKPRENPQDGEEEYKPTLQVSFTFEKFPPKIVLKNGDVLTPLTPIDMNMLDHSKIEEADLVIAASHYNVLGRSGIKAYLRALGVTMDNQSYNSKYGF